MRVILLIHRYLAVAVGVLMTLWCLSGFVMMYQAYPSLTEAERRAGLAPLDLSACCELDGLAADAAAPAPRFRIEMLGGDPVLRLDPRELGGSPAGTWNLRTGERVRGLSAAAVHDVARRFGRRSAIAGEPRALGTLEIDQWTVQTAPRNRPVHKFAFDDAAATEIYVSGASGEVFQDTTRRERVLTWLGAIPHWLYPLELRRNGALWSEIVIWTSVVGTFLAATGIYVGVARLLRARSGGRWSPYRGWWFWHHMTGLVFGVLTLTWVFSGLMTMNPWGTLSGGGPDYARRISGAASRAELERFIGALAAQPAVPGGAVTIESAPFGGALHAVAHGADGSRVRLDASAEPAPLERGDVEQTLARLPAPIRELDVMTREDAYYYGHKKTVDLPVYRAIVADDERTRVYVNAVTGSARTVDATRRTSRWIRTGLHDLDFAGLRERPVWDLVVLPLLAGVTLVCITGTWMALKRIAHDARRMRRRRRKRRRLAHARTAA